MPIYEYKCESCGNCIEVLQKISDARLTDCEACGKPTLQKQVSAAAFKLKGSGWYETDFKNSGKKSPANTQSDSATSAATASSTASNEKAGAASSSADAS